jgi:ferredoxin
MEGGFMKIEVDQMKCRTAGICVKRCPEVFRFQEGSKRATVLLDPIPARFEKKCMESARKCPNNAIMIYF